MGVTELSGDAGKIYFLKNKVGGVGIENIRVSEVV